MKQITALSQWGVTPPLASSDSTACKMAQVRAPAFVVGISRRFKLLSIVPSFVFPAFAVALYVATPHARPPARPSERSNLITTMT